MKNITKKLLAAQKEFPLIKKEDTNPFFKSKYAGLPSVLEVVLPILQKHGLLLIQCPISSEERVGVETSIIDEETGESIKAGFTMALAKNDPQGAGSAITYARRYSLISILGLNVDEDDDANVASNKTAGPGGSLYAPVKTAKLTKNQIEDSSEPFL